MGTLGECEIVGMKGRAKTGEGEWDKRGGEGGKEREGGREEEGREGGCEYS